MICYAPLGTNVEKNHRIQSSGYVSVLNERAVGHLITSFFRGTNA